MADLETLVGQAGMYTDLMHMGAASMVYSPGCEGVTIDDLKRFVELVEQAATAHLTAENTRLTQAGVDIGIAWHEANTRINALMREVQEARRAALEEAAKVCESQSGDEDMRAAAIRALAAEAAQGKGE